VDTYGRVQAAGTVDPLTPVAMAGQLELRGNQEYHQQVFHALSVDLATT